MRLRPIEGDGWYLEDRRIEPPASFSVRLTKQQDQEIEGVVDEPNAELHGYTVSASPRFTEGSWLNLMLKGPAGLIKGYALPEE